MKNIGSIGAKCVGCRGCEQSCPKGCIQLLPDAEGFLYPHVDEDRCVSCGKCVKVCPGLDPEKRRTESKVVWAWKRRDGETLDRSASGGAADAAAQVILDQGGLVYGAAYEEGLKVSHIGISDQTERWRLQSSKYVQSDTKDCYSQAKAALEQGKTVLFTGTPCQIEGLYAFLGGDREGLYTLDLICHGVPSPKLFQKYLEYWGRKWKEPVLSYNFRSKRERGWGTQYRLETKSRAKTGALVLDRYGKHFMDGDCYRRCCYSCPYANLRRAGDITVGDFWGIAKSHPDFFSEKGVSSVFLNTEKGQSLFEKMVPLGDRCPATLEEGKVKQGNLVSPTPCPAQRENFYAGIDQEDFFDRVRVGLQLKQRVKALLPPKLIQKLKQRM